MKEMFKNEEWAKKWSVSCSKKPNKKEQVLIKLLKSNNFPYKYVGNGKVWLSGKNPDFINVNGQKKLIELFGDYWHNKKHFPQSNDEQSLSQHYKKYGFKCLIIWEKELKNSEKVIQKIREFEYG
jgi:G:T-mismatch repair DNA endonuclease (very short patch repair protein)